MQCGVTTLDDQIATYRTLRLGPAFLRRMDSFTAEFESLADQATRFTDAGQDVTLVVPHPIAASDRVITRLTLSGQTASGIYDHNFEAGDVDRFRPVEPVPVDRPYLVVGFDAGAEFRGRPPVDALPVIRARGRSPLTISEGLAVFLHDPATLQPNHCWSLAGSSRGDRRVPALWISKKAPKLGWCFAGAPHDWLGVASIQERVLPET